MPPPRPLLVLLAIASVASACTRAAHPNVVLIVVDTLRKDALGSYGGPPAASPAIDAWAARGWIFEGHVAHASQTVPSMISLMSARLPAEHGFTHREVGAFQEARPVFPPSLELLAEALRGAGYATAGFVANPFLAPESGFGQGFDTFEYHRALGADVPSLGEAWLREWSQRRDPRFFLYLHLMDVHQPCLPSAEQRERFAGGRPGVRLTGNRPVPWGAPEDFAYTRALYQACVADADARLGALLAAIDALGLARDTIVVLTSDHGEEFGEHRGIGHGTTVYGEVVRVPLIVVAEGRLEPGRRVAHLSQHVDLAPSLLDLAGVRRPAPFRAAGSLFEPAAQVFAEDGPWRAVYAEDHKLVWNAASRESALFAAADEHDQRPLDDPALAARLRARLDGYLALDAEREPAPGAPAAAWSEEERERLRALGYAD
jgi:arylsulfatase A-like enzyme